jgi:hypothetical protein
MTDNPYAAPSVGPLPKPPPAASIRGPVGLGGWLILVGISLHLSVLFKVIGVATNVSALNSPEFIQLTTPGSRGYDPMWGPCLWIEIGMLLAMIVLTLVTIYRYFTKQRAFVSTFIILACANFAVALIDLVLCSMIKNFRREMYSQSMMVVVQTAIYGAIWIAYMRRSVRVQNTFVR